MKLAAPVTVMLLIASSAAQADGFATCDSGPKEKWQGQDKLTAQLKQKGWEVRRIKVDGGCYEVYATDDKGQRVEVYFHPVSLAPVPKGSKNFKG